MRLQVYPQQRTQVQLSHSRYARGKVARRLGDRPGHLKALDGCSGDAAMLLAGVFALDED